MLQPLRICRINKLTFKTIPYTIPITPMYSAINHTIREQAKNELTIQKKLHLNKRTGCAEKLCVVVIGFCRKETEMIMNKG